MSAIRGRRQHGFSLVMAIVLLVIFAALGAYMLSLSSWQHTGAALDVQGARAYQAARAGVEWGLFQSLRNNACAAGPVSFSPGGGLAAFTVSVSCTASSADELGTTVNFNSLVATACNQPAAGACPNNNPGQGYVERQVQTVVAR